MAYTFVRFTKRARFAMDTVVRDLDEDRLRHDFWKKLHDFNPALKNHEKQQKSKIIIERRMKDAVDNRSRHARSRR